MQSSHLMIVASASSVHVVVDVSNLHLAMYRESPMIISCPRGAL